MELLPKIVDMLKSGETNKIIELKQNYYSQNVILIINYFPDTNLCSIFERNNTSEFDTLQSTLTKFIAIVDKETFDIIYANPQLLEYDRTKIKNATPEDIKKMKKFIDNINKTISNIIFDKLSLLEEEILNKIDVSKYEKDAINLYTQRNILQNPFNNLTFDITPTIINQFLNNKEEFKESAINFISETMFSMFETYVAQKAAIEKYKKSLTSDPLSKRKKALCDIIDDDAYKSINIHFKLPNGMVVNNKVNKQLASNKNAKFTIMNSNHISNIPIVAIQKITWGKKQVLFDEKDYPVKISDEEYKFSFAAAGDIKSLSDEDYKNKSLMKKIIINNAHNFKYLDETLKTDKDFLIDIISECRKGNLITDIYNNLDISLKTDEDFMYKFLEKGEGIKLNDRFISVFTNTTLTKPYSDEFYKNVILKLGISNNNLIDKIPSEIWNDKNIVEFVANEKNNALLLPFISSENNFKKIFSDETVCANIDKINDKLMKNKLFLMEYLKKDNPIYILNYSDKILLEYKYDEDIMDLIVKNMRSVAAIRRYCDEMFYKYDSDKLFNLISKNVMFFCMLSPNDKKTFLDGELFDEKEIDISFDNNNEIKIKAPNSYYEVPTSGYVVFKDDIRNIIVEMAHPNNIISNKIKEMLEKVYPFAKGSDIREVKEKIIEEKIRKEKENDISL